MTDRELLEAAATAAGHTISDWRDTYHGARPALRDHPVPGQWLWNPLNDDGDALRLAVKLGIALHHFKDSCAAATGAKFYSETHCSDAAAAARRAIVRAAAAMAVG